MEHRHQRRGSVHHGGVHHLALARALALEERAGDAVGEQHAAAAEVAHQVERRHRRLAAAPDRLEGARQRDVVDVVPGGVGHRAVLPPAGHAPVDEARVAGQADVGSEPEALHHARTEALQDRIRLLDQLEDELDAVRVLQVDAHRAAAPVQHVEGRPVRGHRGHVLGAVETQHVRSHVREHHGAERSGADACELQDPDSLERSHASSS